MIFYLFCKTLDILTSLPNILPSLEEYCSCMKLAMISSLGVARDIVSLVSSITDMLENKLLYEMK
jgi:hypothetical protein